jgi:hypothetical protein
MPTELNKKRECKYGKQTEAEKEAKIDATHSEKKAKAGNVIE